MRKYWLMRQLLQVFEIILIEYSTDCLFHFCCEDEENIVGRPGMF